MQKPLSSFLAAFLIWFFLLAIFSYKIFEKSPKPEIALELDISMSGEVAEEKKIAKNSALKKPDSDESSDLKKDEQKKSPHDHHLTEATPQKIAPLFSPLPQIPDDLRNEAFSSEAIARFHIAADGSVVEVELIKPASNPQLNRLLLRSLKNWKFAPASAGFTQDIKVRFSVQ